MATRLETASEPVPCQRSLTGITHCTSEHRDITTSHIAHRTSHRDIATSPHRYIPDT
jgi:hypothetical protein